MWGTVAVMAVALVYLGLVFYKTKIQRETYTVKKPFIALAVCVLIACVISLLTGRSLNALISLPDFV